MNKDEVILILCEVILIDEHQDNKISIQLKNLFSLEFVKSIYILLVFFFSMNICSFQRFLQ